MQSSQRFLHVQLRWTASKGSPLQQPEVFQAHHDSSWILLPLIRESSFGSPRPKPTLQKGHVTLHKPKYTNLNFKISFAWQLQSGQPQTGAHLLPLMLKLDTCKPTSGWNDPTNEVPMEETLHHQHLPKVMLSLSLFVWVFCKRDWFV